MYRQVNVHIAGRRVPFAPLSPSSSIWFACRKTNKSPAAYTTRAQSFTTTSDHVASPRPHVIVIGGGSLGLFHASLFQLRFEHEQQQMKSSASATTALDGPSGSVRVISAQPQLLQHLATTGVQLELLLDFIRAQRSWIPTGLTDTELQAINSKSHFTLPQPVKIPAAANITPANQSNESPTHVLIIVKGSAAVKRAASEVYHLFTQMHENKLSLPAVCILMNGLGHVELIVDQWRELLQTDDSNRNPTTSSQDELLRVFQSRLFTATTTNGAKVEKKFEEKNASHAITTGDLPLVELRVKHGGMGSTTVVQNAWEANEEKEQISKKTVPASKFTIAPQLPGSSSFVTLFRFIGFETHLAPHAAAQSVLYTKLLVNCVINPLTALHYVNNGELRSPEFTEWVVHLSQECVSIINQLGISISDYPSNRDGESQMYPQNLFDFLPKPTSDDLKRALFHVYMTAHRTFHNYSSMVNDLHTSQGVNRPRTTEIDNITGFLLKKAQLLGFKPQHTSYNQEMFDRVKQAERIFAAEPQRSRTQSLPTTKLK